jgi:hypothetical protein
MSARRWQLARDQIALRFFSEDVDAHPDSPLPSLAPALRSGATLGAEAFP